MTKRIIILVGFGKTTLTDFFTQYMLMPDRYAVYHGHRDVKKNEQKIKDFASYSKWEFPRRVIIHAESLEDMMKMPLAIRRRAWKFRLGMAPTL